jgi:hypothetical protein
LGDCGDDGCVGADCLVSVALGGADVVVGEVGDGRGQEDGDHGDIVLVVKGKVGRDDCDLDDEKDGDGNLYGKSLELIRIKH